MTEHIVDIVQNSVRAEATLIEIMVDEDKNEDIYTLVIKDNGLGMMPDELERAIDPFFTSRKTRKVGLGLSLLKQNANNAEGSFLIDSVPGRGTTVKAVFRHSHIDRPPLGDIWNGWYYQVLSHPGVRLVYEHRTLKGHFVMDSAEVREVFEGIPLQHRDIRNNIIELIVSNLKEIEGINRNTNLSL